MPYLHLRIAPIHNPPCHAQLARALTAVTARILGKRSELTALSIEELPTTRWFVDGAEVRRPTAMLEIHITQGSNTPEQKAAFVGAAHAELERLLGGGDTLEPASYVLVQEWPGGDWGYQGRTQAARRLAVAV
jgi:4-oxalocrotonate tautomerase